MRFTNKINEGLRHGIRTVAMISCLGLGMTAATHEPASLPAPTSQPVDFLRDIKPVFDGSCVRCHGLERPRSGFRLDGPMALSGGDQGPAIVPGNSAQSPLIHYVAGLNDSMIMPPRGKGEPLSREQISLLRGWIDQGASWPSANDQQETWWSLQPLRRQPIPAVASPGARIINPIDAFIVARLNASQLTQAPEADRRTLARRLWFDLIGLPPTPADLETFVSDTNPAAYENLVDRLLASPQYGERWARHWLDVVQFGESHGYDKDQSRPHAWPYRDYVIRSFNQDKSYGRFIEEQVAGDVLHPDTRDGFEALGFIAAGPWDLIGHAEVPESKIDGKIARHLDRDNMVTTTIQTFNSLTVQCAQCHHHRFDPITQEDYYSLHAVFAAVDRADQEYETDPEVARLRIELDARQHRLATEKQSLLDAIAARAGDSLAVIDQELAAARQNAHDPKDSNTNTDTQTETNVIARLSQERAAILASATSDQERAILAKIDATLSNTLHQLEQLPPRGKAYVAAVYKGSGPFAGTGANGGRPRPIHLLERGNVQRPRQEMGPGALSCLPVLPSRFNLPADHGEGERRAALAQWLSNPENPLTWRSIVNRVWQYHFGVGLVDTANDFGRMGSRPSHPELLDWLAMEFRDGGQSLKKLHRLMVTSATYRQSARVLPEFARIDSDNRLLWRANRRKLEAEAVRDSILQIAGVLDLTMGGPSFRDFVIERPEHSPHYQYHLHDPDDPASHRRSIYRFIIRSQTQPFMTALDCADPSMQVGRRNESVSPLQALALLNNSLVIAMSGRFAEKVSRYSGSLNDQIAQAHAEAIGRPPDADELHALTRYTEQFGLPNLCRLLFNLNEFSFVD